MSKPFFEVFPTLQLDKKKKILLENTRVERVTSNRQKDLLRIYLSSDHLLTKEFVWDIEKQIKDQLFGNHQMTIKLLEKYSLSSQYTLENLMESYGQSILMELEKYDHILHNMLKNAKITYPQQGSMVLAVTDMVLFHDKKEELIQILEKILVERCGLDARIAVSFEQSQKQKHREEDELRIRRQVAEISRRAGGSMEAASLQEVVEVPKNAEEKQEAAAKDKIAKHPGQQQKWKTQKAESRKETIINVL